VLGVVVLPTRGCPTGAGGTNLPVLRGLGCRSQTPYPYDAYPQPDFPTRSGYRYHEEPGEGRLCLGRGLIDISVVTGGTESTAKTSYAQEIEVYLYRGIADMRKSINGLLTIVEQELGLSPFAPRLFVFCNRQRDKIKIFHWERSGFVLWYKRLEKARFPCPRRDKDGVGGSSSCRGS
jgi:hypothetical protein